MNYYEILEVSQSASKEVIKAAYKSLMQRYHPDKNPGSAAIAERAALVVQAYEVISDIDKRAAYDIKLSEAVNKQIVHEQTRVRAVHTRADESNAKDNRYYRYMFLIVVVILLSGWLIVSFSNKKLSPELELQEIQRSLAENLLTPSQKETKHRRMQQILFDHPEIQVAGLDIQLRDEASRTLPLFISQLTVHLKHEDVGLTRLGVPSADSATKNVDHVLFIPQLSVKVGMFEADKVIQYLEGKRELISRELAHKLVHAQYEELVKIDGEQYLKELILDVFAEVTGMRQQKKHTISGMDAPNRYGVIEIILPESFTVH